MATQHLPAKGSDRPAKARSTPYRSKGNGTLPHDDSEGALRMPPHSIEAEQSVLGGLLLEDGAWPRAAEVLTAGDFYRFEHRLIYTAIGHLLNASKPADIITVFDELQSMGKAEDCGGMIYLHELVQSVPSASGIRTYAQIVRDRAGLRSLIAAADRIHEAAYANGADPSTVQAHAREVFADAALAPVELFHIIDMAALQHADADAQAWCWAGYIPSGHVTLLGGHGGAGKSILALHLAACVAMGVECFGRPTLRSRVLYFSAEDPASLVLRRLRLICRHLGFPLDELAQWLQVLDASDLEPVLFAERRIDGLKLGMTTPAYRRLADYLEHGAFGFAIIDNASDAFDGDEINRPMVRAFIRSLATLARSRNGGVLLLAHVDKFTSRAGKQAGGEAYSGSTAWHNSVRSRLFLLETEPGLLELQHQKCNLGPKLPPLLLEWPEGDVMKLPPAPGGFVAAMQSKNDMRTLLVMLHEFEVRGEYVTTATTSRTNAALLFAREKQFPRDMKAPEVFNLLRDAERAKLIGREQYRGTDRKLRERWALTKNGCALIGVVAATAATSRDL